LKLLLMEARPFRDKPHRTRGQPARDDSQGVNCDFGFGFSVLGVEMWRGMIREVHLDDDP